MNESENGIVYTYSVEELDEIISKINKGINVVMTPELQADLQLRYAELAKQVEDEDDVEEFKQTHAARIQKNIEKQKRQATKKDVLVIELSEEQKAQLRQEMSSSIVRNNPDLAYHKRDEELYDSAERKEIYTKLNKLKKCYYNQQDWQNAVKIILSAVEYSLRHDYPWMSYEEAVEAYNKQQIRFEYCQMPKLYLNWTTIVDDPTTLKGIFHGTIKMIQKDDEAKKKRKKLPVVPERYEVDVTGVNEWNYFYELHKRGYDTPISPVIKAATGSFSRFALPDTNWFYQQKDQQNRMPVEFDWLREGAGEEYYNLIHGIQYTTADLLDDLQRDNNGNLNQAFQGDIDDFLRDLKNPGQPQQQNLYQNAMVQNPDQRAIQMEQSILQAMRNANPNK